jgi:cytochrome c556
MKMRFVPLVIAASFVLLACGGSKSGEASNAQGNLGANVATTAAVVGAAPSAARGAAALHERHEGMETIGKTTKALHREIDASAANFGAIRAGAATLADLSRKSSGWFPAGSGPEAGKTGAKPAIWQDPKDFAAKLAAFQKAAAAFNAAAASQDMDAIHARFSDLGGTCKACHDKYRSEMHH